MMRAALAGAWLGLMPMVAGAQTVGADAPETIVQMLQGLGYGAVLEADAYGDPIIRSAANGVRYAIQFYSCTNGAACQDLQFVVAVDVEDGPSLAAANSWNRTQLIGRMWIDEEGDPFLEFYLPGATDIPPERFVRTVGQWTFAMQEFLTFIDW